MVVQAGHIGGRGEVVLLEQAGLARSNPVGGSEAVGRQSGHHHGLIAHARMVLAEASEHLQAGLVPSGGQDGGFALGTTGAKEEDGLVVGIGEPDGQNQMTGTHVEGGVKRVGNMELLQGHFAALFVFHLMLVAFRASFHFVFETHTAGFELNLDAKVPVLVEPIVAGQDETGDGDGIRAVERARAPTVEDNLRVVVHELGQNLAVAAEAEFLVFLAAANLAQLCRFALGLDAFALFYVLDALKQSIVVGSADRHAVLRPSGQAQHHCTYRCYYVSHIFFHAVVLRLVVDFRLQS